MTKPRILTRVTQPLPWAPLALTPHLKGGTGSPGVDVDTVWRSAETRVQCRGRSPTSEGRGTGELVREREQGEGGEENAAEDYGDKSH